MAFGSVNQTTGARTQLAGLFSTNTSGGVESIAVNGVAQTITQGAVDLDVASNLITEVQWTSIQSILS